LFKKIQTNKDEIVSLSIDMVEKADIILEKINKGLYDEKKDPKTKQPVN